MTTPAPSPVKEERIEEPAKAWRNWFKTIRRGGVYQAWAKRRSHCGEVVPGAAVWPSRDVAETKGLESMAHITKAGESRYQFYDYLGAFPEGERP